PVLPARSSAVRLLPQGREPFLPAERAAEYIQKTRAPGMDRAPSMSRRRALPDISGSSPRARYQKSKAPCTLILIPAILIFAIPIPPCQASTGDVPSDAHFGARLRPPRRLASAPHRRR